MDESDSINMLPRNNVLPGLSTTTPQSVTRSTHTSDVHRRRGPKRSRKAWQDMEEKITTGCIYCFCYLIFLKLLFCYYLYREREMFYLTTLSTHFIYGYMASDIWLRTILIVREETRCRHIGYSYRLTARVLLYAPSHRQDNTYHGLCYTSSICI